MVETYSVITDELRQKAYDGIHAESPYPNFTCMKVRSCDAWIWAFTQAWGLGRVGAYQAERVIVRTGIERGEMIAKLQEIGCATCEAYSGGEDINPFIRPPYCLIRDEEETD